MYNSVSKILTFFFDPLILTLFLLVCAWSVRRRPRVFQTFYATAALLLALLGCPAMSGWLTDSLEDQYPDRGVTASASAQAIVVLGGAIEMPGGIHRASGIISPSDRLLMALRLYRAGKAPLVVLSGGNNPLMEKNAERPEADEMRALLEEWGIPATAIVVEDGSINTRENALFSQRLLAQRGIERIILVTSALHMPRAAATFRKVGFNVVVAPADFRSGWEDSNSIVDWLPAASALEDSRRAIHEWLGVWVYRLHGWT